MGSGAARGSGRPTAAGWTPPIQDRQWERDAAWQRPGEATRGDSGISTFESVSRAWLDGSADDPIRRLGLALVAWPPIGLAAASVIGELTGCATYAATCGGSDPLLPWLAQAPILGVLLLFPSLTRILVGGVFGVLLAIVPLSAFLVAASARGGPQADYLMAALLGVGWIAGVAWAARKQLRGGIAGAGP
jgi:hypothetical protein